jgi:hypothetical protein
VGGVVWQGPKKIRKDRFYKYRLIVNTGTVNFNQVGRRGHWGS